jgi:pimeloyl-ACP methyl ester carboxylesterase
MSVERLAETLAIVLLTTAVLMLTGVCASADAEIDFVPCRESNALACGNLTVPLSHSGALQGTITLALRRRRAPVGDPRSAVIALAGGPGQAAIPFTETFAELLGPIISTRDLIVFDQRGTGLSGALRCPALDVSGGQMPAQAVKRCASEIGPGHGSYTTSESVADIEAIRLAGGYEKLVLYGTSYGTKVALQYAQQHPSHVEALILDSVVPPNGPEPLHLPTFAAVPRVLRELCAFHGCRHITNHPVADLHAVVSEMQEHPLRATAIDGSGLEHTVHITSASLLDVLLDGDLDPILRAEFPAAIRSAAEGDPALLARLLQHAASSEDEEESEQGSDPAFDSALYFATMCEEEQFPWKRASSPAQRLAEARAKIGSLPASAFAPFSPGDALPLSDLQACAAWPFTLPSPPLSSGPLPAVPTLIVSGAEDLRTPTSGARSVAASIPGAHLLVVPNTGHSVLTTEPETCALNAMHALLGNEQIKGCKAKAPPSYLKPTPLAPRQLAALRSPRGYRGRAGRTLTAVGLTLADLSREFAVAILDTGGEALARPRGLRIGGLRGGWVDFKARRVVLHDYAYVPGVQVSGWTGFERAEYRIGGRAASAGTLSLTANRRLVGTLGGVRIDIPLHRLRARIASSTRSVAPAMRLPRDGDVDALRGARAMILSAELAQLLQSPTSAGALQALTYALTHTRAFRPTLR